jgi:hypothetical protein
VKDFVRVHKKRKRKAKMNTRNNWEKNRESGWLTSQARESEETEFPWRRKGVAMKEGSQRGPVLVGT